jgi:transposase
LVELAKRGLKADCRTVWNFVHVENLSFKKARWLANAIAPTSRDGELIESNIKRKSALNAPGLH